MAAFAAIWLPVGFVFHHQGRYPLQGNYPDLFTSTVHRKELVNAEIVGDDEKTLEKTLGKTPDRILPLLKEDPNLAIPDLAERIGKSASAVERAIRKLRQQNRLQRIGPAINPCQSVMQTGKVSESRIRWITG